MICRACKQDLLLEEMVRDTRRKNGHDSSGGTDEKV